MSVSRGLFLSVAIVAFVGVGALFAEGRFSVQVCFRVALAAGFLPFLAFQLPVFKDGMQAFGSRWESATIDGGGFQVTIFDRVLDDLFGPFRDAEISGLGTGFSTTVGQKILTQERGFGASEGEWGRLLFDNGMLWGCLLIIYRTTLAGLLVFTASRALRRRSFLSLVFASAAFLQVLDGQWGQSTTLGSAAICGGLALAAGGSFQHDELNT